MQVENLEILKEEGIPAEEMGKQLNEFLKQKHVREGISKDEFSRLKGLMNSLKEVGCGQEKNDWTA